MQSRSHQPAVFRPVSSGSAINTCATNQACFWPCRLQVLEVMWEDSVALCLTPQAFSNIHPAADIFNNINKQVCVSLFPRWPLLLFDYDSVTIGRPLPQ